MNMFRHMVAYVTLGLLCGWYYFLLILYPTMIYLAYFHRSYLAGCVLAVFITLTFTPLKHEPQGILNTDTSHTFVSHRTTDHLSSFLL